MNSWDFWTSLVLSCPVPVPEPSQDFSGRDSPAEKPSMYLESRCIKGIPGYRMKHLVTVIKVEWLLSAQVLSWLKLQLEGGRQLVFILMNYLSKCWVDLSFSFWSKKKVDLVRKIQLSSSSWNSTQLSICANNWHTCKYLLTGSIGYEGW